MIPESTKLEPIILANIKCRKFREIWKNTVKVILTSKTVQIE